MSSMLDEGNGGPAPARADGARRVLSDPKGVTFSAPGWTGPIWRCNWVHLARVHQGDVIWDRYDIDAVRVSHVAALLLQQGMPTSELFPPNGHFEAGVEVHPGPFFFLAGRVVLFDPPPRIEMITLGRLIIAPMGAPLEQIIGRLVETVLEMK